METANPKAVGGNLTSPARPADKIRELFGSYKAEWLEGRIFDLFTEPDYLTDLESPRPCVLMGGRGTGKTTVLRLMSYEGSSHRFGHHLEAWPYIGVYHRINSNRVTSFEGRELSEKDWTRVFGHYFNLLICDLLLDFAVWCEGDGIQLSLVHQNLAAVSLSLGIEQTSSLAELAQAIKQAILGFEFKMNNIADGLPPNLSVQGAPIEQLTTYLRQTAALQAKPIFILLDEYETLLEYQQRSINTLIKHPGASYTFKIGVKDFGWKTHETLAAGQHLSHPADYAQINITDRLLQGAAFGDFAEKVCNGRLSTVTADDGTRISDVTKCFNGLGAEQEAHLLGVRPLATRVWHEAESQLTSEELDSARELFSDLELYFADLWAHQAATVTVGDVVREALADPQAWKTRYSNYRQAILYTVKRGKAGIRKYYCGWETFAQLAAGNIRYLMQLVETCFVLSAESDVRYGAPFPPELQTRAAQIVGQNNLNELQAVSVEGARLTRLVLGLGRVFGVMAADPMGHTPEVTQFKVNFDESGEKLIEDPYDGTCRQLLTEGLMQLALVSQPGTKLTDTAEIRDAEYRVHPIYSAFFVFSAGRKRRVILAPHQLVRLAASPRTIIREILSEQKRRLDESLPEHMALYSDFYRDID